MPGSDCDCASMTLGEVDYILGEPESNNYVLNTTTLYASFLNDATSYVAENDNLSVLRQYQMARSANKAGPALLQID